MSTDPNEFLNELARRGTPRGADAVLANAALAAQLAVDAGANNGMNSAVPAVDLTQNAARPRRSIGRRGFGALGLAALLGIGGYATLAVQGNGGGADSPQEAVAQLADAINHSDILSAVDIMAPSEVRALHQTVSKAQTKAADEKLVRTATKPLAGLTLNVKNLHTNVEALADGFAKVTLTATIHAQTKSADFGRILARATHGRNTTGDLNLSDIHVANVDPFVMAVRDGDGWYISPAYTAFEYVRLQNHLPAADFGSGAKATLGAESPEVAATEAVRAVAAHDWAKVASLLPPAELPVYDYRAGFAKLMNDAVSGTATVTAIKSAAKIDGDEAEVSVDANGTNGTGEKWSITKSCFDFGQSGETAVILPILPNCFSFSAYAGFFTRTGIGGTNTVHASKINGRWFISPISTVLNDLDSWVTHLDHNTIAQIFNQPLEMDSQGTLALNKPATLPKPNLGASSWFGASSLFRATARYTLTVSVAETVVTRLEAGVKGSSYNSPGIASIFDGEGKSVEPGYDGNEPTFSLQPGVQYSVLATSQAGFNTSSTNTSPTTFTVWRSADAPAIAPSGPGFNGCTVGSSGKTICELTGPRSSDGGVHTAPTGPGSSESSSGGMDTAPTGPGSSDSSSGGVDTTCKLLSNGSQECKAAATNSTIAAAP